MKLKLTAILALLAAPALAQEAPTGDAAAGEKVEDYLDVEFSVSESHG